MFVSCLEAGGACPDCATACAAAARLVEVSFDFRGLVQSGTAAPTPVHSDAHRLDRGQALVGSGALMGNGVGVGLALAREVEVRLMSTTSNAGGGSAGSP